MTDGIIFHNPDCGTSRNTLGMQGEFRKEDGKLVVDADAGK